MYRILDYYHPYKWKCYRIGLDLTELTWNLGFRPLDAVDTRYGRAAWADPTMHAHVRKRTLRKPDGAQWHQDGDYGHVPMDHGLILWSNTHPTELRDLNGKVYVPPPFAVVYFRNLEYYHRRPPRCPAIRYIFRQRVE